MVGGLPAGGQLRVQSCAGSCQAWKRLFPVCEVLSCSAVSSAAGRRVSAFVSTASASDRIVWP